MNKVVRTASRIHPFQLRQSFFHSSPILERRRRTHGEDNFSNYYKMRSRKMRGKSVENVNGLGEDLFQSWQDDFQESHLSSKKTQSSRRTPEWFTEDFYSDSNRRRPGSRGPKPGSRRRFDFWEDDGSEVENTFHASFGDDEDFFYTFTSKDFESNYTSSHNTRSQRKWKHDFDYEYDYSEGSNCSTTDLSAYRQTLGLKASGPLSLEDVKNAYRTCAFKWHPDRHQGSSKAVAEEKFKTCSAAYQSLCDKLALD